MLESAQWQWKAFHDLSSDELYNLLQLRSAIFVVEQHCVYQDLDGLDQNATHCLYCEGDRLLAYQRSLAPGVSYADASAIGRIIVSSAARGRGLGRELVRRGVAFNLERWPAHGLAISAQAHLRELYESQGFAVRGEPYMEDGIPHLHMRYAP